MKKWLKFMYYKDVYMFINNICSYKKLWIKYFSIFLHVFNLIKNTVIYFTVFFAFFNAPINVL